MDDDIINNINKKLEELENKYELIKKENMEYKRQIKQNEQTIVILNKRIDLIKKENLNYLEKYLIRQFPYLKQIIENKENIKKGNNEININEKKNELWDIERIYEEIPIMIDKKIREFEMNFIKLLEYNKIKIKKIKSIEEMKLQPQKNEIKERTIDKLLNVNLTKIFSEQSPDINIDDINDLKKICSVLIINKREPSEKIREFLNINLINFNELDENQMINISSKKTKVFQSIEHIELLKEIKAKDEQEFIKQFREKYGITEKDYNDKKLKKQINKGKKEIDILKKILTELKYFE
jgi:hypothetical protein